MAMRRMAKCIRGRQRCWASAALDYLVPVAPVQPEANQIINRMVEDVLFGDSSIEDALASAEAEIQELLDAFWEEYG